jgi:trk system potassium uptake protein
MRAVFIGASSLAVTTARFLLARGHEVVIVERNKERIEALTDQIDAGFLHGDGSTPAILRETNPNQTDFLFCLTGNDQANIIAGLVGRSLGFPRVVTKIENSEFEHICMELGLKDTIIPNRTIGRYLADMFQGSDPLELTGVLKDEARIFFFVAQEADEGRVDELKLAPDTRIICLYREGKLIVPDGSTKLKREDEVALLTHSRNLPALHEQWGTQIRQHPLA